MKTIVPITMPIKMTSRKVEGDHWEWKETARWVKFEEDVEEVFLASSTSTSPFTI